MHTCVAVKVMWSDLKWLKIVESEASLIMQMKQWMLYLKWPVSFRVKKEKGIANMLGVIFSDCSGRCAYGFLVELAFKFLY